MSCTFWNMLGRIEKYVTYNLACYVRLGVQNMPGYHLRIFSQGQTGGKNCSSTFVPTAFISFGQFDIHHINACTNYWIFQFNHNKKNLMLSLTKEICAKILSCLICLPIKWTLGAQSSWQEHDTITNVMCYDSHRYGVRSIDIDNICSNDGCLGTIIRWVKIKWWFYYLCYWNVWVSSFSFWFNFY
jgi:hypothetical protein